MYWQRIDEMFWQRLSETDKWIVLMSGLVFGFGLILLTLALIVEPFAMLFVMVIPASAVLAMGVWLVAHGVRADFTNIWKRLIWIGTGLLLGTVGGYFTVVGLIFWIDPPY